MSMKHDKFEIEFSTCRKFLQNFVSWLFNQFYRLTHTQKLSHWKLIFLSLSRSCRIFKCTPNDWGSCAQLHSEGQHSHARVSLRCRGREDLLDKVVQRWPRVLSLSAQRTTASDDLHSEWHNSWCKIIFFCIIILLRYLRLHLLSSFIYIFTTQKKIAPQFVRLGGGSAVGESFIIRTLSLWSFHRSAELQHRRRIRRDGGCWWVSERTTSKN